MNKALALACPEITFASLKPAVGSPLQLECADYPGRMTARLLGYQEGTSLMISVPRLKGAAMELCEGSLLQAKLITGVSLYGFSTELLCSYNKPSAHWHLSYPTQIVHKVLRQHTRVPVNLLVSVDEVEESSLSGIWPQRSLCTDISLKGLNLLTKQVLGEVGDKVYITLRLKIAELDQVLLVSAVICNIQHVIASNSYKYGVEFYDLDEEANLVLAGFCYQQCLLEAGFGDYSRGVVS